nr:oleate hydratase [Acidovorax sp. IB03]
MVSEFFMSHKVGDRPGEVSEGAVTFAFIGQFAESRQRG